MEAPGPIAPSPRPWARHLRPGLFGMSVSSHPHLPRPGVGCKVSLRACRRDALRWVGIPGASWERTAHPLLQPQPGQPCTSTHTHL